MTGTTPLAAQLMAVDVGNSSVKLGRFRQTTDQALPSPVETRELAVQGIDFAVLQDWLPRESVPWYVASVFREIDSRLGQWVRATRPGDAFHTLSQADFPLRVEVDRPASVGADRLAGAVAANLLRNPAQPAVVIDAGSAITVDVVGVDGSFLGGAILPGLQMAAQALSRNTDLLPFVNALEEQAPPPALGKSTQGAILSGIFWGTVGAVQELKKRVCLQLPTAPQVFVTGGDNQKLQPLFGADTVFVPHLVLSGVAATAMTHVWKLR